MLQILWEATHKLLVGTRAQPIFESLLKICILTFLDSMWEPWWPHSSIIKLMTYKKLKYEYHDSQLENYQIGPRNDLTLNIFLDPVWNNGAPENVSIRLASQRVQTVLDMETP